MPLHDVFKNTAMIKESGKNTGRFDLNLFLQARLFETQWHFAAEMRNF